MNTEEMQKQIESMMPTPEQIVEHLDKKLEEARRLYKTANSDQKYVLESLFPQLSESEDDRMRKNIKVALMSMEDNLADFYSTHHTSQKELIAWLEKQGQKETAWSEEDEENMNNVLYILNQLKNTSSYEEDNTAEKTINWFKSLKDRLCLKLCI